MLPKSFLYLPLIHISEFTAVLKRHNRWIPPNTLQYFSVQASSSVNSVHLSISVIWKRQVMWQTCYTESFSLFNCWLIWRLHLLASWNAQEKYMFILKHPEMISQYGHCCVSHLGLFLHLSITLGDRNLVIVIIEKNVVMIGGTSLLQ